MAKKKAKSGRPKAAKKAVTKKKVRAAKKTKKVVKKKAAQRKPAKKKVVKKVAKKVVKKVARKAPRKVVRQTLKRSVPKAAPPPKPVAPPPMPAPPPPPPMVPPPGPMGEFGPIVDVPPPAPAELSSTDEPYLGAEVGDVAPDFALRDQTGRVHTLREYRGQKVVLYFYPKDDTPGCTTEACAFRDNLQTFHDRNTVVLGVSPDAVDSHERFVQKYGLTFPLLADEGHKVAELYGAWGPRERGGVASIGLNRTTFVIDASGYIAHVFRQVKADGHAAEVLERVPF